MHDASNRRRGLSAVAGLAFSILALPAAGQVAERAAFVGNYGNLEGSVTSFTFSPAGEPQFIQHLVLGSGSSNPSNNVYSMTLSPDGRYLATTHATGVTPRLIHILRIEPDATMSVVGSWPTYPSPLHARWINGEFLAVTMSNSGSADSRVVVYRFDEHASSPEQMLALVGGWVVGDFCTSFAIHPNGQFLYAENGGLGGPTWVRIFQINPNGTLTALHTEFTSGYMLGLNITRDGRWLFGGGGALGGGANTVQGFGIDEVSGMLSWAPGPTFSSGSPKQTVPSSDGRFLFVAHGSSAAVRSFAIDELSGALTDTGNIFSVGSTGDLGNVAVLDELLLFTRQYSTGGNPAGLFSFTIQNDGSFTLNEFVQTGATRPFDVAVWSPPETTCYPNCDGSTTAPVLNVDDFTCFINEFAGAQGLPHAQQVTHYANCDGSTTAPALNVDDFTCFINAFAQGCP